MTPALQQVFDALTQLGCKPTKSGNGISAFCPIHEADGKGHKPSLTANDGDTAPVVVNCHAGCDGKGILQTLGINGTPHKSASIVATYRYQTAEGIDIREKVRHEPKDFRIRHRDAAGAWVYKAGDGPAVLYRLPELRTAIAEGRIVFVVEGEKDADRLASLGLVATCNIEGAAQPSQRAKWKPEYTDQLSGATRVVLVPDNDDPGRAHMRHIAAQLARKVTDVRYLELPGLQEKGDVSDWLDAGHTADNLKELVAEAPGLPEEPKEADKWANLDDEFMPIGDFIASPPNSSYLVKGILPSSGIGQVFGCSHVGKSFVLIDLACRVALGWDWHGHKVKKAPVLYIAAEGVSGLKLRFRAWFQEHGVAPPSNLRIRTIPASLTAAESTAAIAERMERLPERPGLVLIDTFATNFGAGSENDGEDMGAAIAGLNVLKGNGLILSAHHTGHGDKTRSRGHSSLFAAIDVELQVTQDADKRILVGHTKLRDGDRQERIAAFELRKVFLPWADEDGDPLNSAVLVKADIPDMPSHIERLPASQRIALDALRAALVDHGTEDKGVVSVAEDQWRQAAYAAGISDGDSDAKKKAFKRARLELVAKGKAKTHEGRYWIPITRVEGQKGTKGDMSLSVPDSGGGQKGTHPFKGVSPCPPVPPPTDVATYNREKPGSRDAIQSQHDQGDKGGQGGARGDICPDVSGCTETSAINPPTTETNGIGGTDELSQPTPPSTEQAPPFPGSKGGPVISQHPGEAPTEPLSPLGGRILKAVQATSAGFDTNELARQVGNGKGASLPMVEHELTELARHGLVSRINGRWVAGARP